MMTSSLDLSKTEQNPGLRICPHLGMADDQETQFNSPDIHNTCFQAQPPHRVSMRQQMKMCLTKEFTECPVYQAENPGPLPRELQGRLRRTVIWDSWRHMMLLTLSLGALLGLAYCALTCNSGSSAVSAASTLVVPAGAFRPATQTATVSPKPTLGQPSRTLQAQASSTPATVATELADQITPGPALETPFGRDQAYLVHLILEGETLDLLAERYDTSVAVLQVVNLPPGQQGIWANLPLVVLPGQKDTSGLPRMQAEWVEEKVGVADLAAQNGMDETAFRQENNLLEEWVPGGRWVVVHVEP